MKRFLLLLMTVTLVGGLALSVATAADDSAEKRGDVLYVCACGAGCDCNSMDTEPGDCACGKPMQWTHVVKVEGNEALLCTCGEGCKCSLDASDPTRCNCGKPIKRVSLAGQGIYFCNCGGACTCNTISKQPGDCKCGMKLKKVM